MVDVFISYSRRDLDIVALIARSIEAEGYAVWWDADIPPHQSYGDVITAQIDAAKAALVVWSAAAAASEWVRAEADMARNHKKLIQTAVDGAMPPLPFNQIQYAKLEGWQGEPDHPGWRMVKRSLADLCGPREGDGAADNLRPVVPPAPPKPAAPAPPYQPQPAAPASKWPLFVGIAVGAVILAAIAGLFLGQRTMAPIATAQKLAPVATPNVVPSPEDQLPATDEASDGDDGEVLSAPDADMTIPDSSTRLITESEIAMLGPTTLKIARNEIYARKGRRFQDPWLADWFSRYAWYRPLHDEVPLNPIEKQNVALIRQAEARYGQ